MNIRALIVDDEPPARARVAKLLSTYPEIRVIGECRNGLEALEAIESQVPDLVFLDIQMPELNGFEVLQQLSVSPRPFIIFTTAFDQYALKAFEHHAVDYLLKPIERERFKTALEKVLLQIKGRHADQFNDKLKDLLGEYESSVSPDRKNFVIKDRGKVNVIHADDIFWLASEGNYVTLHTAKGDFLYRSAMTAMETELQSHQFVRIHRSILVNTLHIARSQYLHNETFKFVLNNQTSLISGRSYKENIQGFLQSANYIKQF